MLGASFVIVIILLFVVAIVKISRREDGHPDTYKAGFGPVIRIVGGILIGVLVVWLAVKLIGFVNDNSSSGAKTLMALIAFMGMGLLLRWIQRRR